MRRQVLGKICSTKRYRSLHSLCECSISESNMDFFGVIIFRAVWNWVFSLLEIGELFKEKKKICLEIGLDIMRFKLHNNTWKNISFFSTHIYMKNEWKLGGNNV